jgi:Fe(II)/alpha-ketoglutarate-dependent arginine beta-hydroxylase
MSRIVLTEEVSTLRPLISDLASRYDSAEDTGLLMECAVLAHELPRDLRAALLRFKLTEPASGLLVISGFPIAEDGIGATPEHWQRPEGVRSTALEYEILLLLAGSLLGDLFGWATQQGGRIVHDLLPIKGLEQEQIGTGSEQTIWWHTEDAFHPLRGDYVGMLCLRNFDRVPTTIASLENLGLADEDWEMLFQPLYTIRPDNSHQKTNAADPDAEGELDQLYHGIEEMQRSPEKISILSGDPGSPYIRIDPYFMDSPADPRAERALGALIKAIDAELRELVLEPGDICFMDNFKVVHGRRGFKARYDGRDRWLKRVNITRDLRKSRSGRGEAIARVILQ